MTLYLLLGKISRFKEMDKELIKNTNFKDFNPDKEITVAIIKPIGTEINLGNMCVDLLNQKGMKIVNRTIISNISEKMAIDIYKQNFHYLRNLSIVQSRAVIDSITCGPIEVQQIEGPNAKKILREITGSVNKPENSLRYYTSKTVKSNVELRQNIQTVTGLDYDEAIIVANGIHSTKDIEELETAQKIINELKIPIINNRFNIDSNNIEVIKPLIYNRRGVRVDIIKINNNAEFYYYALKQNSPGFWNETIGDFVANPKFINDSKQKLYLRHNSEVFKNEKETMVKARNCPQLKKYIPKVLDTGELSIATEFIPGVLLEEINEAGSLAKKEKNIIISQLLDYVYWLHKVGIYHNDLHGRSIMVNKKSIIKVIDYSMSGKENTKLPDGWDDIGRLNQNIIRTLAGNTIENIRRLTDKELFQHKELSEILKQLPFDKTYPKIFEQYQELIKQFLPESEV